jgi:hypothetical protein
LFSVFWTNLAFAAPIRTEIVESGSGYQLLRDGEPYFVKGAGAREGLADLAAAGANSIRTWGAEDIGDLLDEAHRHGLSVTVGIWLRKEYDNFDYDNPADVQAQFEKAKEAVDNYKDHPALLMWAVGNEMELGAEGPDVWKAVEQIAAMIQREDPNHPVISVVADMWPEKMDLILEHCPSLDALGVNSYTGLPSLHERMEPWTKPYFITEYAFQGQDEHPETPWGVVYEPTSTQKAELMREHYQRGILDHPGRVLGGYAFYWGPSDSSTAAWHSLLLKTGERLGATDALQEIWSGKLPENQAPVIEPLAEEAPVLAPGETLVIGLETADPDGDPLTGRYEVLDDDFDRFVGDFEKPAPLIQAGQIVDLEEFILTAPPEPGIYQLVVIVVDGNGKAATAKLPFQVSATANR